MMNSKIVNVLLFVALFVAIGLFYHKYNKTIDWLDKRKHTISFLKAHLPSSTILWVDKNQLDPQMLYSCRYILAPIPIIFSEKIRDTMLYVYPIKDTIPTITFAENNRKIYWQNQDDEYRYLLIVREK